MAKRPAEKTLTFSSFSRRVGQNSFVSVTPEEILDTFDSQFPLASSRFGRDSIPYRVGKTHCQGHQDPSKRVPIFPGTQEALIKMVPGSHFAESYCIVRTLNLQTQTQHSRKPTRLYFSTIFISYM